VDRRLTQYDRGDGACGKTSLLNVFTRGYVLFRGWIFSEALVLINGACRYFPTVYEPTVFENYVHGKPEPLPASISDAVYNLGIKY